MNYLIYLVIGLVAGMAGGAFGIGGGSIMVPALVILCGLSQHQAQGTTLAVMLLPVMILAVWRYYQQGHIIIPIVIFISIGFTFGALLGANLVQGIPANNLQKAFGVFMILMGLKLAFF